MIKEDLSSEKQSTWIHLGKLSDKNYYIFIVYSDKFKTLKRKGSER